MGLTGLTMIDCDELKHFDTFLRIFWLQQKTADNHQRFFLLSYPKYQKIDNVA